MERQAILFEKPCSQIEIKSVPNSKLNFCYSPETDRLKTFANCYAAAAKKDDLAALGLYYVQQDNVIKCVFCDIKIVEFSADALVSHVCSCEQDANKNHPALEKSTTAVLVAKRDNDVALREEKPSEITTIEKEARETWLDKMGIRGNVSPKFARYSTYKDRFNSYITWSSLNQKPSVLSEAGFFYIGVEDRTACFHCGGGLREWKETDDPWIEHAHWFPKCKFMVNVKGKEFIEKAWGSKLNIASQKEVKNPSEALNDLIGIINLKSMKKEKSQAEKISRAPSLDVKKNSSEKDNSSMTCRICFENERNVMFEPCHHVVSCNKCAMLLKYCVICRVVIKDVVRVFLP